MNHGTGIYWYIYADEDHNLLVRIYDKESQYGMLRLGPHIEST